MLEQKGRRSQACCLYQPSQNSEGCCPLTGPPTRLPLSAPTTSHYHHPGDQTSNHRRSFGDTTKPSKLKAQIRNVIVTFVRLGFKLSSKLISIPSLTSAETLNVERGFQTACAVDPTELNGKQQSLMPHLYPAVRTRPQPQHKLPLITITRPQSIRACILACSPVKPHQAVCIAKTNCEMCSLLQSSLGTSMSETPPLLSFFLFLVPHQLPPAVLLCSPLLVTVLQTLS